MGSVFRAKVTRPLPSTATLITRGGKQFAEWRDSSGKIKRARTTGPKAKRPGIIVEAATFTAKFRDGSGIIRKVATGCRTREAAKQVLADLEARAEKVRSGVFSVRESEAAEHLLAPIGEHVDDYARALGNAKGKGAHEHVSKVHVENVRRALLEVIGKCGFRTLRDLDRQKVREWAVGCLRKPIEGAAPGDASHRVKKTPGPRTINAKLTALTAFGNWLAGAGRLIENPFERLEKLDESDDVRRKRRALTGEQLNLLLTVARLRPLGEKGRATVRRQDAVRGAKSRATWNKAPLTNATIAAAAERGRAVVRPDVAERLELQGLERALLYEVMLTTGLRKKEVSSLTVGALDLREESPTVTLLGVHAKNGKRSVLPLRTDVAGHLRDWLVDRRRRLAERGESLSADAPLFRVPKGLIRILNRDLAAAGIPKLDERGHSIDVHAMRTTFNTHLVVAGVDPRTAMAAMRVSSLNLVLQTYADEKHFDVKTAVRSLPAPPAPNPTLAAGGSPEAAEGVVPVVVPTSGSGTSAEGHASPRSPSGEKSARAK